MALIRRNTRLIDETTDHHRAVNFMKTINERALSVAELTSAFLDSLLSPEEVIGLSR